MAIKVKVCGLKYPDNIAAVCSLDVDFIGFIFYDKSKRYVGHASKQYIGSLKQPIKVGVFVNADLTEICTKIDEFNLNMIQLHGNESPEFCKQLSRQTNLPLIKAFGIDHGFDWSILNPYTGIIDYFLFDTKSSSYGGTGVTFDWSQLNQYKLEDPYFLSGGLDADNIQQALAINDPRLYALDLNSKFEIEPGLKDINLLTHSINSIIK